MKNEKNLKAVLIILVIFSLISMIASFTMLSKDNLTDEDVQGMIDGSLSELSIPTAEEIASLIVMPEVVLPEVENADNALLNNFLEEAYAAEFDEIEVAAEEFALEELEENNYEVIFDYLNDLFPGIDEDSLDVDVREVESEVTMLGLEEDADKEALVSFEVKVYYEFEEGINDEFKEVLDVVYKVSFDEGDLLDERTELISIL